MMHDDKAGFSERFSGRRVISHDGAQWPALGIGTWRMGEDLSSRRCEVSALRRAFEIGYRLVDTAEMYGDGGAERVLGEAIRGAHQAGIGREELLVVSKFYPHHAGRQSLVLACEASLRRLGVSYLHLYLLHWRGATPLAETLEALDGLRRRGLIHRFGVSNFDCSDMIELMATPIGGGCAVNQVYYSLGERGIEFELLPWQQGRGIPLMAYCPIDQGRLAASAPLRDLASLHDLQPAQLALAWLISHEGVIAIPKAGQYEHLVQNWAAARIELDPALMGRLDTLFPPPEAASPLTIV